MVKHYNLLNVKKNFDSQKQFLFYQITKIFVCGEAVKSWHPVTEELLEPFLKAYLRVNSEQLNLYCVPFVSPQEYDFCLLNDKDSLNFKAKWGNA